ncbi:MAG: flagellar filament capping protein FliD, partial [Synergistaceae bacterium]|nr:flagellar filament capping protein FliD [Synergistaceae bacterium]
REAEDAEVEVDGVTVVRSTNTIDDLIAGVTLELKSEGHVKMDIVQDVSETIEDMEAFVEAYNKVMEWINFYVEQKEDAANQVEESDDLLSSIIKESKGNTVFGLLHGDQMLWSIKNQLRGKISNPITTLADSAASRKFLHPSEALSIKGSFNLYIGGTSARIDVAATDSLTDIRRKIEEATSIFSADGGNTPSGSSLGLTVTIRDGQLVIDGNSKISIGTDGAAQKDSRSDTLTRSSGSSSEYLSYVPITASPVSGQMTVYSGAEVYQEGSDYKVVTETNDAGVMSSRIEWIQGGKSPAAGRTYNVTYAFNPNGVMIQPIAGTGPSSSEIQSGMYDVSYLDFHAESSKISLSNLGITTESENYGKSGYLEFDSDKFIAQIEENPDATANAMMSFMRDLDTYIGNLVDSSNILVAGTIVTKGRIAGALTSVDSEISALNERITRLERQLEEKQTALYKQYSSMEQAIQKMNAQMSSISNYLSSMSSGS